MKINGREVPIVAVLLLTAGEFTYGFMELIHEGKALALYLAVKYTLAEKWSPFHIIEEAVKRHCWKHIPGNQCIPDKVKP